MKRAFRLIVFLAAVLVLLGGVLWIKSDTVVNWTWARKLSSEPDVNKRIVLMNMSRAYSPTYWNPKYIQETLRASTEVERRFLADLVYERFGTNGIGELHALLSSSIPQYSETNVQEVVSFMEKQRGKRTSRQ